MIKNRLKVILAEKNISQKEMAESLNMSKGTLSNIINGNQNSPLETAIDIANYLNEPVEKIFYKYIEKDEMIMGQDAQDDFGKMLDNFNEIYHLYEKRILSEPAIVNLYADFIRNYVKKHGNMALDIFTDIAQKENTANRIALKLLWGIEGDSI